jgi:hypothetical protein
MYYVVMCSPFSESFGPCVPYVPTYSPIRMCSQCTVQTMLHECPYALPVMCPPLPDSEAGPMGRGYVRAYECAFIMMRYCTHLQTPTLTTCNTNTVIPLGSRIQAGPNSAGECDSPLVPCTVTGRSPRTAGSESTRLGFRSGYQVSGGRAEAAGSM